MRKKRLDQALAHLADADRADLLEHWRKAFRCAPPRYVSVELLRRAVGHNLQERKHGGLSNALRRQLKAIANGKPIPASKSNWKLKPGVRLLREWHGKTHEVIVTDRGYVWAGTTYKSLSAVAQAITGTRWNGHRFFGLVNRRKSDHG